MLAYIVDVFVNFIADYVHTLMLAEHLGQSLEFSLIVYRTSWVAGRTKNDGTCFRCDSGLELCGSNFEILLYGSLHKYGLAISHEHHLRVAHPIRCRNNYLLTR